MTRSYFKDIAPITYGGPDSSNPLSFRHYDKDRVVLGKRMEDHLRFAVCYWHTFCWNGLDPFGGSSFLRPWFEDGSPMELAQLKAENAFDFFAKLGAPYYCFHDRDVAPAPRPAKATTTSSAWWTCWACTSSALA
jgi:xylose isomerase